MTTKPTSTHERFYGAVIGALIVALVLALMTAGVEGQPPMRLFGTTTAGGSVPIGATDAGLLKVSLNGGAPSGLTSVSLTDGSTWTADGIYLGPVTGNTTSGSLSVTRVTTVVNLATATGTGTGTVTVAGFFPAGCTLETFTGRVTVIFAGAALTTWSIGPSGAAHTDLDAFGTGLALAANTLVRPQTFTITSVGQVFSAAHDLVLTAAAGVFSTGSLTVTVACKYGTPVGS